MIVKESYYLWLTFDKSGYIKQNKMVGFAMVLANILSIPIFPIVLILVKAVSIFHHGKEWKQLKAIFTYYEGQFESFFGFGLQTYILLERADRQPSMIQKVSILASLLMMVVSAQSVHFTKIGIVEQSIFWPYRYFNILKLCLRLSSK